MKLKELKEKYLLDLTAVLILALLIGTGVYIIKNTDKKEQPIEIIQNEEE